MYAIWLRTKRRVVLNPKSIRSRTPSKGSPWISTTAVYRRWIGWGFVKRLAWFTGVILATFTVAILFWEFRAAVVLFIVSLVIAASLRPVVDWFARRGLPRGLALLFAYAVCVGFIVALVLLLSGPLLTDLQQLTKDVTSGYEQLRAQWPTGTPFQTVSYTHLRA